MDNEEITILPFGDHAILVQWQALIEETILNKVIAFEHHLKSSTLFNQWEFVSSYHSLTLINTSASLDFRTLKKEITKLYSQVTLQESVSQFLWEIPVCYETTYAKDLAFVAKTLQITPEKVIELHKHAVYTLYGIGFLPGFLYLGDVPKELQLPRRDSPRLSVPKGAVGLAGGQTGIYPQVSPGGWHLIGHCPIPLFNPLKTPPIMLQVGDKVQFKSISSAELKLIEIENKVGIYTLKKTKINATH